MDRTQLVDRIRTKLEEGASKEAIFSKLLEYDYEVETIQEIVKQAEGEPSQETAEEPQKDSESPSKKEGQTEDEDNGFNFLEIVSILGAVLVGAGVISLVAANWQETSDTLRLTFIFIGMLGAYSAGGYARFRKDMVYTGDALLLLGNIVFGAGIFLIGQIYNLQLEWPSGFMLWTLGSLAVGMATRVYPILYMTLILLFCSTVGGMMLVADETEGYLMFMNVLPVALTVAVGGSVWWLREELPPEDKQTF